MYNHSDEHLDELNDGLGLDISTMLTHLHKIARDSKIYGETIAPSLNSPSKPCVIIFKRLDGMYSVCELRTLDGDTVLDEDGTKAILHLSAVTPLVAYKDGYRIYRGKYSERV